ncbi:hypothetical protein YP76_17985 [Sphingobium chungbukense]|uniref:Uncharacterized protein n=1 Tax=Sphingobium chungbukense TaxID=56193 RepID=A0A0M3AK75_9SPHN|nr:hypothetical protein K426_26270 [Sphingobium sp. TKS]KKW90497.1 hypothetical protein YP76_17985 [Sphingobium chungbukense]
MRHLVDGVTVASTHSDNDNNHLSIVHFVDETITDTAQLDFIAILARGQAGRRDMWRLKAFYQLLLELFPNLRIEFAPFL